MTKKFKYPLRITGTEKQLRDIAAKLHAFGYSVNDVEGERSWTSNLLLVTNAAGRTGNVWVISGENAEFAKTRTEVSADNPDLVLALAASVDDDNYHEREIIKYADHKLYRLRIPIDHSNGVLLDWIWQGPDGRKNYQYSYTTGRMRELDGWSKATKEEIINHFTQNTMKENNNCCVQAGGPVVQSWAVDETFIKEAHAAACAGWKERIEQKFPTLFPAPFDSTKTYAFKSDSQRIYKLQRLGDGDYAFVSLSGSDYFAAGTGSAQDQLNWARRTYKVFEISSDKELANWILSR